jgi:hypothetical protein
MLTSPRAFLTPLQPPFIVALVTSSNIKNWDYDKRTLDFTLPSYVAKALQRFNHPIPAHPQHASASHLSMAPRLSQPRPLTLLPGWTHPASPLSKILSACSSFMLAPLTCGFGGECAVRLALVKKL